MGGQSRAALSGKLAQIHSSEATFLPMATEAAHENFERFVEPHSRQRVVRILVLAVGVVAVVAASITMWTLVLRDRFVPKRFGVVVPGKLYRSGQISRSLIAHVVDRNQIGTIVDLNGLDPNNIDQRTELEVAEAKGIRHLRFPLRGDATGPVDRYAAAVQAIVTSEREGLPVLVHCAAGTQRTGACVSFYRLLVRKDPPGDVYRELIHYGWDPRANRVLLEYVNGHMHEVAQMLVDHHIIDGEPSPLPTLHP